MNFLNDLFFSPAMAWSFFGIVVTSLLILDLGVFHRKNKTQSIQEAFLWSLFWIACGLLFGVYIWITQGSSLAAEYITAYIVEKSLSVDNLFVFIVIFSAMKIEMRYQHRLLFWGILGAIVLRAIMIFAGVKLIELFHPVLYVFGAFLVWTGIKLLRSDDDDEFNPKESWVFKNLTRFLPFEMDGHPSKFVVRSKTSRLGFSFTKSFLALALIESSDVLFALDSVPAVLGISKNPFVVYTSNIFAILGLRSLFFVLESLIKKFQYLNVGIALVLIFVGAKMIAEPWIHIEASTNLFIIGFILSASVIFSGYKRN